MNTVIRSLALSSAAYWLCCSAQTTQTTSAPSSVSTSVNAGLVLDAAGPEQRKSLGAIYLVLCPHADGSLGAGSGFLLDTGVMVTNSHVVDVCTDQTLVAIDTSNRHVKFSRVIKDTDRDLALLVPKERLTNGLKLAPTNSLLPGTSVTTWGYPFVGSYP